MTLQWHHHANAVGGKGRYWITQLPTGCWEARQFTVADDQLLKVMQCPSEAEAKAVCELWDGGASMIDYDADTQLGPAQPTQGVNPPPGAA
jgi:hypothetical protein